jgi:uncharacterized protein (DUF1501 family)
MFGTRRSFLKTTLASTGLIATSWNTPQFLSRAAAATPRLDQAGAKDTILVVVQLTGGNDGLNTVIPFTDPLYAASRPTLKQKTSDIKKLNKELALHPAMSGLAGLWEDQALTIVQGVGYPNPNQSHFTSMDIWHSAFVDGPYSDGWLGRSLGAFKQTTGTGYHLGSKGEAAPLALTGPIKCPTIASLADMELHTLGQNGLDRRQQRETIEKASGNTTTGASPLLDFVQRTANGSYNTVKRLRDIAKNYTPQHPYPAQGLAERLKLAAQLIDANVGARIYYVEQDGYDTHSDQAGNHTRLLTELSESLTAFYKDLKARGHHKRVLILTFSEFGRRVKENGSLGTDHGAAAPVFLLGGTVKPGVIGKHPRLDQLDDGNLKHHTDFRSIYATILDQWLGVESKGILQKKYEPLGILKA